jgi:hypothetical protein
MSFYKPIRKWARKKTRNVYNNFIFFSTWWRLIGDEVIRFLSRPKKEKKNHFLGTRNNNPLPAMFFFSSGKKLKKKRVFVCVFF